MAAVLIASDLTKDMAGIPLFNGVSFKLERRERLTLSGVNGSGKTTLLRALAGEESLDGGELSFAKGARISLHDQRPPRERGHSLGEYVFSGCSELLALEKKLTKLEQSMADGATDPATYDSYSRAQAALEHAGGYAWREGVMATMRGLGFDSDHLERRLDTFSGGELTRASLARALAGDPDLLLLDEPTNHLDIASLEWLENYLQNVDAAVVLVAHDRWFLEAVGTAVLELHEGRGRFFPGTWHAWRREKAARELALGRTIERQQAEMAKLERFVDRFRAGTRARQAQSRAKRLDKLGEEGRATAGSQFSSRRGKTLEGFNFKQAERSGRVIFELEDATLTIGDRVLLEKAKLWLERGEHVTLIGPNGAGKSTLLDALTGERELTTGKLRKGHNVQIGLLSQHADDLVDHGTVLEAAQRATKLAPNKARALLGQFLFSGEDAEKPMAGLSGGEQQRLSLAILVHSGSNVLILDEPTNHLDVESREALEDALQSFNGTILLITHDRALLDAVGTRTIAFENQNLRSYLGGWPGYLAARAEEGQEERAAAPSAKAKKAGKSENGSAKKGAAPKKGAGANKTDGAPKPLSPNRRRQIARLETQIQKAEAALAVLEDELANPGAWNDPRSAAKSAEKHALAKKEIESLYEKLESSEAG